MSAPADTPPDTDPPLYLRLLGPAWAQLPPEIRQLHHVTGASSYQGHCTVERGGNRLARLMAAAIGFPDAGEDQNIRVQLIRERDSERWIRTISGKTFASIQLAGRGRSASLVRERFGPIAADMELAVKDQGLRYLVRRWSLCGIPMPLILGPQSTAVEFAMGGAFCFDVSISHPFVGLIVRYRGQLTLAN